jgi:hypothetical protein
MDEHSFENEVKRICSLFEQKETEGNWTQFDDSLQKLGLILQGSPELQPQLQTVFRHKLKDAVCIAVRFDEIVAMENQKRSLKISFMNSSNPNGLDWFELP